jgi:hypothetical protein
MVGNYSGSFSLFFQNEHVVYENVIKCTVKDYQFNQSYNPTLLQSGSNSNLVNFATGSDFHPYCTTVGLYDSANNLLAVAKIGQPVHIPTESDFNIIVKFDT